MERITRSRSMKIVDAKDDDDENGGSAPPTAAVYRMTYPEIREMIGDFAASESELLECLEAEKSLSTLTEYYDWDEIDDIELRRIGAEGFRSQYTYGSVKDGCNNSMEQKTCIWPGGTLSWQDELSGTMWVAVHGMDSICVVTRSGDLDPTRLQGSLKLRLIDQILFQFRKSVIVEIEDLVSHRFSEISEKRIEKPFGVVSVFPGAYKGRRRSKNPEASSVEHGKTKAVEFLQEKLKSDTVFTVTETIQTAIAAFGHLFQKKLKDDDIQVSVMDPNYTAYSFEGKDPTVKDLKIRQINEHLAVINKKPGPPSKRKMEPHTKESSSGGSRRRLRERKL